MDSYWCLSTTDPTIDRVPSLIFLHEDLTPPHVSVPVVASRCHGYIAAPDGFFGVQLGFRFFLLICVWITTTVGAQVEGV